MLHCLNLGDFHEMFEIYNDLGLISAGKECIYVLLLNLRFIDRTVFSKPVGKPFRAKVQDSALIFFAFIGVTPR